MFLQFPFLIHEHLPGDIFKREVELGCRELQLQHSSVGLQMTGSIKKFQSRAFTRIGSRFERDQDAPFFILPGPDTPPIDKRIPKDSRRIQLDRQKTLVSGVYFHGDLRQNGPGIGRYGPKTGRQNLSREQSRYVPPQQAQG